jgi:hypothetical protein
MLLDPHEAKPLWFQYQIPTMASLLAIALIVAIAIGLSLTPVRRSK